MLEQIASYESNVRGYVRLFPTVFDVARGSELWDAEGKRFIDFFCGAGTLNYGHNNPKSKHALLKYIERDGIQHALDTATSAKVEFLTTFQERILQPRGLDFRVQFTGPTGTNAVEAAIKLARMATKRSHLIAFTHGYHGHSLGSLALTGNSYYHSEYYGSRNNVSHFPFDGYCQGLDSTELIAQMLDDPSSGIPLPAAIVVETVQGEGGVNVASVDWLRKLQSVCHDRGILLIVDDIQVGNGRTGAFFSFEEAGLYPDLVCLSKSIGGGLPMSLVLVRPEHDIWQPGQHTGTFRGNNLAFVAARSLLDYWWDESLMQHVAELQDMVQQKLQQIVLNYASLGFSTRGRGLIQGLDLKTGALAKDVIDLCFEKGLLIESSGADDEVLKVMPALTISKDLLSEGLNIVADSIAEATHKLHDSILVLPVGDAFTSASDLAQCVPMGDSASPPSGSVSPGVDSGIV